MGTESYPNNTCLECLILMHLLTSTIKSEQVKPDWLDPGLAVKRLALHQVYRWLPGALFQAFNVVLTFQFFSLNRCLASSETTILARGLNPKSRLLSPNSYHAALQLSVFDNTLGSCDGTSVDQSLTAKGLHLNISLIPSHKQASAKS